MRLSELVPSLFPIRIFPYNDDVVFYLYYCNIIGEVTLHLAINALLVSMLRDSRCSNSSQIFLDVPIEPNDFHLKNNTVDGQMLHNR